MKSMTILTWLYIYILSDIEDDASATLSCCKHPRTVAMYIEDDASATLLC